jgi:hypothetical protein
MPIPQREQTGNPITIPWWQPYVGAELAPADITSELLGQYLSLRQRVQQMEQALLLMPTSEQAYGMSLAAGIPVSATSDFDRAKAILDLGEEKAKLAKMEREHPDLPLQASANPQFVRNMQERAAAEYARTGDLNKFKSSLADIARYNVQPVWPTPGQGRAETDTGQQPTADVLDSNRPWWQSWMTPEEESQARGGYISQTYGTETPFQRQQYADALQQQRQQNWYQAMQDQLALEQQQREQQAAWQQAQTAQAFRGWQQGFGWQLPKDVPYVPGYGPGEIMAQRAAKLGTAYNPEAFRNVDYPAPQLGAMPQPSEREQQLRNQLAAYAMTLGQGG